MRKSAEGRRAWSEAWPAAVLLAAAFLFHRDVVLSPFMPTGDFPHGLGNPGVRSWANLPSLFTPSYTKVFWEGSYHPLATLAYFINYRLFGLEPLGFRVFRMLLLWASGLLAARAVRPSLGRWSWAAAALVVVHPVPFVDGLLPVRDQFVAFFALCALLARERAARAAPAWPWSAASVLAVLLALLSKETGAVVPALLLGWDVAMGRIPPSGRGRGRWAGFYLSLALVTALYLLFLGAVIRPFGASRLWGYASSESVWTAVERSRGYASVIIGPAGGFAGAWGLAAAWVLLAWTAWRRDRRLAAASLAWIVLGAAPVTGLLPVRQLSTHLVVWAETGHYLFLPILGFAWLTALALKASLERAPRLAACVPLVILLGLGAEARPALEYGAAGVRPMKTVGELTTILSSLPRMKAKSPELYAFYRERLQERLGGDSARLEAYFDGALQDPCRSVYLVRRLRAGSLEELLAGVKADESFGRGCRAARQGDAARAFEQASEALRDDEGHVEAYLLKARSAWAAGRKGGALADYRRWRLAAEEDQRFQAPWCGCGPAAADGLTEALAGAEASKSQAFALFAQGRLPDSLERLDSALELDGEDAEALLSRGVVRDRLGDRQGALSDYARALESERKDGAFRLALRRGRPPGAEEAGSTLTAAVLSSRAETWLALDRREKAAEDLREALRGAPADWPERAGVEARLRGLDEKGSAGR